MVQEGRIERRAGYQCPSIINSQGDRTLTRMALMDHTVMSLSLH